MDFPTTLLFVILASGCGIHNVHAQGNDWENERGPMQLHFFTFLETLETIARAVHCYNPNELQVIDEKNNLTDYTNNYIANGATYRAFLEFTTTKINFYITSIMKKQPLKDVTKTSLKQAIIQLRVNIEYEKLLPKKYKGADLPLRERLQLIYTDTLGATQEDFCAEVSPSKVP